MRRHGDALPVLLRSNSLDFADFELYQSSAASSHLSFDVDFDEVVTSRDA